MKRIKYLMLLTISFIVAIHATEEEQGATLAIKETVAMRNGCSLMNFVIKPNKRKKRTANTTCRDRHNQSFKGAGFQANILRSTLSLKPKEEPKKEKRVRYHSVLKEYVQANSNQKNPTPMPLPKPLILCNYFVPGNTN
jgi:uncharacterized protein (UPF0335 family)